MKNLKVLALPLMLMATLASCGRGYTQVSMAEFVAEASKLQEGMAIYSTVNYSIYVSDSEETIEAAGQLSFDLTTGEYQVTAGEALTAASAFAYMYGFSLQMAMLQLDQEVDEGTTFYLPFRVLQIDPEDGWTQESTWDSNGALTLFRTEEVDSDDGSVEVREFRYTYAGNVAFLNMDLDD